MHETNRKENRGKYKTQYETNFGNLDSESLHKLNTENPINISDIRESAKKIIKNLIGNIAEKKPTANITEIIKKFGGTVDQNNDPKFPQNEEPTSTNEEHNENELVIDDNLWVNGNQESPRALPQASFGFDFFSAPLAEPVRRTPYIIVDNNPESSDFNREETRFDIRSQVRY